MSRITKALLIAAIAVMLVGATSAYGYLEIWNGWFNSGQITLDDTYTFDYVSGEGTLEDTTAGSVDSFTVSAIFVLTFTCEGVGTIKLWPGASGWKYTGQSGHKQAHNGEWAGYAILYIPNPPNPPQTVVFESVWGTWNTDADDDYFHYHPETPTYSAHWVLSGSSPPGLGGDGGSAGDLQD